MCGCQEGTIMRIQVGTTVGRRSLHRTGDYTKKKKAEKQRQTQSKHMRFYVRLPQKNRRRPVDTSSR